MKSFARVLLLTICILMISVPVFAGSGIRVQLNGDMIDFTDTNGYKVEPQIVNDRTMVPMRRIFEVLGADVSWNAEDRSIRANTDELEIGLQINNTMATVKDKSGKVTNITLDSAPVIINDRTLVPVRFIAESLDKKVGWDVENRAVIIIDPNYVEKMLKDAAPNLYEFLSADTKAIETYEMEIDVDGNIELFYEGVMTAVDIDGKMELKLADKALKMNVDLKLSGFEEAIKELGTDKVKAEIILDCENEEVYIKSDLIENSDGKWVTTKLDEEEKAELREILKSAKMQAGRSAEDFIDGLIIEEGLNLAYYSELEEIISIISKVMGDDNLKVYGTTNKTYTFNMDLNDLLEFNGKDLTAEERKEIAEMITFKFGFESKIQDGVSKKSSINFLVSQKGQMKVDFNLDGEFKSYNEKVNIQIPNEKNVVDIEEIQENKNDKIAIDSLSAAQIMSLNSKIEVYVGNGIKGTEVKGLIRLVNAYNANEIFPNGLVINDYTNSNIKLTGITYSFEGIKDSSRYNISLGYDSYGYVSEINISR